MLYTRRELGKMALATIPAAGLWPSSLEALTRTFQKPNSKWAGVQVGLNVPYNFGNQSEWPADAILKATVDLGVSGLELRAQPIEIFAGAAKELRVPAVGRTRRDADARAGRRAQTRRRRSDQVAPGRADVESPRPQKDLRGRRRARRDRQVRRALRPQRRRARLLFRAGQEPWARARCPREISRMPTTSNASASSPTSTR